MAARRAALDTGGSPTQIWEPVARTSGTLTTSEVLQQTQPPDRLPVEIEAALIAAISEPAAPGETHHASGARREREIGTVFAGLDPIQAYHLGRRLDLARPDDALAVAFHERLAVERRTRLRAFLANTRRRAASR